MTAVTLALVSFVGVAGLVTILPGLDTALVLRTSIAQGGRAAMLAALGIASGCLIWALIVAFGLGALLTASNLLYSILRWVGAAYLAWLGYQLLRHPRRSYDFQRGKESGSGFSRGLLTNLLNPKVGVFYVSFLPQFVPHGVRATPFIMVLGAIHVVLGLVWFALLIAGTERAMRLLRRPKVVTGVDRIVGGAFLASGAALVLGHRPT